VKEVLAGSGFFPGRQYEFFQFGSWRIDRKVLINGDKEVNNPFQFKLSCIRLSNPRSAFHDKVDGLGGPLRQPDKLVVDHD
jgi:hypothetical protein